jgi:hypothetical protein
VAADPELQAWWAEVKGAAHPDLVRFGYATEEEVWGFSGPITGVAQLTRVLATIAWVASGVHAAVNFPQVRGWGRGGRPVHRRPLRLRAASNGVASAFRLHLPRPGCSEPNLET